MRRQLCLYESKIKELENRFEEMKSQQKEDLIKIEKQKSKI